MCVCIYIYNMYVTMDHKTKEISFKTLKNFNYGAVNLISHFRNGSIGLGIFINGCVGIRMCFTCIKSVLIK